MEFRSQLQRKSIRRQQTVEEVFAMGYKSWVILKKVFAHFQFIDHNIFLPLEDFESSYFVASLNKKPW